MVFDLEKKYTEILHFTMESQRIVLFDLGVKSYIFDSVESEFGTMDLLTSFLVPYISPRILIFCY